MSAPAGSLTLLADGRVLEAGGQGTTGEPLASAAVFDPRTNNWDPIGELNTPRGIPMAVALKDGRVLVAGGFATAQGDGEQALSSAELFDPATGSWTPTGDMSTARVYAPAVVLDDGLVLVAGGASPSEYLASAEIYDPATGTWTGTGDLPIPRAAALTKLNDGTVLLMGGGYASTELFDPATGEWSATGQMITSRDDVQAVLLQHGSVLATGGGHLFGSSCELYSPVTGSWSATAAMAQGRGGHIAVILSNGLVLVAGGQPGDSQPPLASAELYDSRLSRTWSPAPDMTTARANPFGVALPDGRALVAGGFDANGQPLTSAEVYAP